MQAGMVVSMLAKTTLRQACGAVVEREALAIRLARGGSAGTCAGAFLPGRASVGSDGLSKAPGR